MTSSDVRSIGTLVNTGQTLQNADGYTIESWELKHEDDDTVLSAWANHFREHYCDDGDA